MFYVKSIVKNFRNVYIETPGYILQEDNFDCSKHQNETHIELYGLNGEVIQRAQTIINNYRDRHYEGGINLL